MTEVYNDIKHHVTHVKDTKNSYAYVALNVREAML